MNIKKLFKKISLFFHNPIVQATYHENLLTIKYKNGDYAKYTGQSTVWFTFPYCTRCSTNTESRLANIYKYIKTHGNPYPIAHHFKK